MVPEERKYARRKPIRGRFERLGSLAPYLMLFLLLPLVGQLFSLSSCSQRASAEENERELKAEKPKAVLLVEVPGEMEELWKRLPQGPIPTLGTKEEGRAKKEGIEVAATLSFTEASFTEIFTDEASEGVSQKEAQEEESRQRQGLDSFLSGTVSRTFLAPAVPLWDQRTSISSSEISGLPEDTLRRIEEIEPPLKALLVDGKSVEDSHYPLVEEVYAELRIDAACEPEVAAKLERWFEEVIELTTQAPQVTWVGGVGDMMLQRGIQSTLLSRKGEEGLSHIFGDTLEVLRKQDLLIGNLEGTVTRGGTRIPKSYNFRFDPDVLPHLRAAGFDYLSVTNNHCYDYGKEGFVDTLENLKFHGIATSGAGKTEKEAHTPSTFRNAEGRAIRVLSVGAYPRENNGFDGRSKAAVTDSRPGIIFSGPAVLDTIRSFASKDSIDIVAVHGGKEWSNHPVEEQRSFYRRCIEAGADLVLGSHPHVLQGMEGYEGGVIAYSLGNFLFPGMYEMPYAEESLIFSVGFVEGRVLYVRPYPVEIDHRRISLDTTGTILPRFFRLSEELK